MFIFIFLGEKLIVTAPPTNITANKGDNVRINCLVKVPAYMSQKAVPHIKWKHQGHYIHHHDASEKYSVEDKGQTLLISNIRRNDAGQYSCIATIEKGRDMASGWLYVRGNSRSILVFRIKSNFALPVNSF